LVGSLTDVEESIAVTQDMSTINLIQTIILAFIIGRGTPVVKLLDH